MNSVVQFLSTHQVLANILIWPLVTILINALFGLLKTDESKYKSLRILDAALSAAGFDAGKLVDALKKLTSPPAEIVVDPVPAILDHPLPGPSPVHPVVSTEEKK